MYIGIDGRPLQLDANGAQGAGVHLRGWIEAAQALDTHFSFSLLFDPALPMPSVKLSSTQWQLQPLSLPFSPPDKFSQALRIDQNNEFVFDSALESFLIERGFDLFYTIGTWTWDAFAGRRIYHTRWVVGFHDLTPLAFGGEYTAHWGERGFQSLAQRIGAVVYAQRVQTISRAAQTDLVNATGLSLDKIDLVYTGVDSAFSPLEMADGVWKSISDLGISGPYILGVSGSLLTGNLRRLLEAYRLLPDALGRQFSLVVSCGLSNQDRNLVQGWLTDLGIQDRAILLNTVSQRQLVALYNGAALLLYPSLHENFGFPVLEAMRCGTPVVTSSVSCIPEIVGDAAELVDPYQPSDMARGMVRVLQSPALQSEMRERGYRSVAIYSWERTAEAVLDSFAKAIEEPPYTLKRVFPMSFAQQFRRLRVAYWSPLSPRPSGISQYSELLIAELGKYADIDIFVDGYQPSNMPLFDSFPIFSDEAYSYIADRNPYDIDVYQVGNNPLHLYMYEHIFSRPGIVTLHDLCIFHLVRAAMMRTGRGESFWREVAYCEGVDVARQARTEFQKGTLDTYRLSLNKRLVLESRGVIVHSQFAKRQIETSEEAPPVGVIPLGIFALENDGGRFGKLVRRLLGLPEDGFVFGVFGKLHRVKRIAVILRAFARVRKRNPHAVLFITGPTDPSVADVLRPLQKKPRLAQAQGVYVRVTSAGYDYMLMSMQAVDVGINLRYPTAGETSWTLNTLLGQGKPTIVSGVGSFAEYPDACCLKTPVDEQEEDILVDHMLALMDNPRLHRNAERAADAYSQDKTWPLCAQRYLDFIEFVLRDRHSADSGAR
jgi:glycosyltransferase involved in cell wall biosynthesis